MTLKIDVPDVVPLNTFRKRQPDPEKLLTFLVEMEFKTLVSSISATSRRTRDRSRELSLT